MEALNPTTCRGSRTNKGTPVTEKARDFIRSARRTIYPLISFDLARNNHYGERDYLDVLAHPLDSVGPGFGVAPFLDV